MKATTSSSTLLVIALVAAASHGCSSDVEDSAKAGSAACRGSGRRATQFDRNVSFSDEVLPILRDSCSFSSCHGTPGRNGLYLIGDASTVRAALLETSLRASMPFVTPGKPDQSWLLRKLDADFCGVTCNGGCGERMPKRGDALDPAATTTIATWIGKGGLDN